MLSKAFASCFEIVWYQTGHWKKRVFRNMFNFPLKHHIQRLMETITSYITT